MRLQCNLLERMREFDLIKTHFTDWSTNCSNLKLGIGDDCLVWQGDQPLVISTDTAVQGVHFPEQARPDQVASRAFLSALSDLAAMGASAEFFTLALSLPADLTDHWLSEFAKQLRVLAQQYQIVLAGGDTTRSKLITVTISVHGCVAKPLLRSGAIAGDDIWVTGRLGGAAAALPTILANYDETSGDANLGIQAVSAETSIPSQWLNAYWQPDIPMLFAKQASSLLNSAIDISDGLMGDAGHLARASQVDLEFDIHALPLAEQLQPNVPQHLALALAGGDDYQLCFTATKAARQSITLLAESINQPVSLVGRVVRGNGDVRWYDVTHQIKPALQGYQHF